jgi:hypothetical protein
MAKRKKSDDEILAEGLALMSSPGRKFDDDELELMAETGGILISAVREVRRLKQRVVELEAKPPLKYLGVWRAGKSYQQGSLVTCDGSVWHCDRDHPLKPGLGNSGWTLAVKRGKDAR